LESIGLPAFYLWFHAPCCPWDRKLECAARCCKMLSVSQGFYLPQGSRGSWEWLIATQRSNLYTWQVSWVGAACGVAAW
jgi:hypothetical protein